MKIQKFLFQIFISWFLLFFLSGCVSVPVRETLLTYNINGISYLSLASLCTLKGIDWEYDAFTRTATLSKDRHKINLMVGDRLILVDGSPLHLRDPVDIYNGMIVVPYKFKEQVIDTLLRKFYPPSKIKVPLSKIRKVVIDAGHGGNDPGAIGRTGLREKAVTLDIAKRLRKLLKDNGIEVVMTRSYDTFISLSRRVDITNASGAELFISIHANANRIKSLQGFEVYCISRYIDDAQRAKESASNAVLDLEQNYFASDSINLKAVLWDMIYTLNRANAIGLADSICRSVERNLNTKVLGIKGARFYVLKGARIPAVLIETGFLSNINEERLLRNGYYRQQIAEAIWFGLQGYAKE